jgi:hypothetical protein
LALTTPLSFMAKGIHTALGAQVCIGAGLEVVIVASWCARCVEVAGWARAVIAGATVVKLTGWALTLRAIAVTCRTVIARWTVPQLLCALAIAGWAVTQAITADMAIRTWCTAATTTTVAATTSGFGVANALHHFTACSFGCSSHHIAAWGLA